MKSIEDFYMGFNFFKKTDAKIQDDVMTELKWDPRINSNQVTVTVQDGIASLFGSVPHYFEKNIASEAAQKVGGVRAVANELEVTLLGSYERTDSDIAQAAINGLEWSYYQVPKAVKVAVEKGWIILSGETDWDYQRKGAANIVGSLMGVRGVSNNISIKSQVKSEDVKASIENALKRSAENEAHNISVGINGNQVTLTGSVHSFSEIKNDLNFAA
jgi:osmotically-inducible protein OsmY